MIACRVPRIEEYAVVNKTAGHAALQAGRPCETALWATLIKYENREKVIPVPLMIFTYVTNQYVLIPPRRTKYFYAE